MLPSPDTLGFEKLIYQESLWNYTTVSVQICSECLGLTVEVINNYLLDVKTGLTQPSTDLKNKQA